MLFLLSIVISTNKTEAAVQDINEGKSICIYYYVWFCNAVY